MVITSVTRPVFKKDPTTGEKVMIGYTKGECKASIRDARDRCPHLCESGIVRCAAGGHAEGGGGEGAGGGERTGRCPD